jgi:hypothetical protein
MSRRNTPIAALVKAGGSTTALLPDCWLSPPMNSQLFIGGDSQQMGSSAVWVRGIGGVSVVWWWCGG